MQHLYFYYKGLNVPKKSFGTWLDQISSCFSPFYCFRLKCISYAKCVGFIYLKKKIHIMWNKWTYNSILKVDDSCKVSSTFQVDTHIWHDLRYFYDTSNDVSDQFDFRFTFLLSHGNCYHFRNEHNNHLHIVLS